MAPLDFELPLTAQAYGRWCFARDQALAAPAAPGTPVPLPFLVFLRAQPIVGVDFHEWLGRDPDRGLYGGVAYRELRPLRVGQCLAARAEVTRRREVASPRGQLTITTLLARYLCDGVEHATEEVRMIDLPSGPPGDAAANPPVAAPCDPAHPLLARVPPITRRQVAWLTVETGDVNALHVDAEYAAQRGFPDVVVPATLITALLEREIAAATGRPVQAIDVRYHAPTHPGEVIELYAAASSNPIEFQAIAGGCLKADGSVRLKQDVRP
ncbi:MAG: MaoC family dehydratase [Lautropia sp.]